MTIMLKQLDLQQVHKRRTAVVRHRGLKISAGTGYNAALTLARLQ